jgi:hypothetical protein
MKLYAFLRELGRALAEVSNNCMVVCANRAFTRQCRYAAQLTAGSLGKEDRRQQHLGFDRENFSKSGREQVAAPGKRHLKMLTPVRLNPTRVLTNLAVHAA